MKQTLEKYFIYFMFYSIIGWIYEVVLEVFIYRWGFSNRGTLFGPYCIIYGVGALAFILCLKKLKEKKIRVCKISITPIIVFLGIVAVATGMELIGSYIMEWTTGSWMWNYERFSFNFQGRIALNPSIRFGIGGMIFMYAVQPLFEKFTDKLSAKALGILSGSLAIILAADAIVYVIRHLFL